MKQKKRLGRPPLEGGGEQVYFRASEALLAQLNAYLAKQRSDQPGLSISRASIIRDLLWSALRKRAYRF
mgnify:CR=1 FL=1